MMLAILAVLVAAALLVPGAAIAMLIGFPLIVALAFLLDWVLHRE